MNKSNNKEIPELTNTLVIVLDHQGRILFFNKACENSTGLLFQDVKGKEFWELLSIEEEKQSLHDLYKHFDPDLIPKKITTHFSVKDGEQKVIKWASSIILNRDNSIDRIICFGKDIADVKEEQQVDINSEVNGSVTMQNGTDAFVVADIKGRFIDVNEAYISLTGYSRQDILCMTLYDIEFDKKQEDIELQIQKVIQDGYGRFECKLRCRDGNQINVELDTSYINVNGGLLFYAVKKKDLSTGTDNQNVPDISVNKSADIKLNLRAQILDATLDSIFVHDFNGNFIYVNSAAYLSRGYTKEEMMGLNIYDLCISESSKHLETHMKILVEKGTALCELVHRCKDGKEIDIEFRSRIITIGNKKSVVSIGRDVTEFNKIYKRYNAITSTVIDGLLILDHVGNVIEVNNSLCKILEINSEELHQLKISDLAAKGIVQKLDKYLDIVKTEGTGQINIKSNIPSGKVLDIEINGSYLAINEGYYLLLFRDISESVSVKKDLYERKSKIELVDENGIDLTYHIVLKPELKIKHVSPIVQSMTGYSAQEIIKSRSLFLKILHPDDRSLVISLFKSNEHLGKHINFKMLHKNGKVVSVDSYNKPIIDENGITVAIEGIVHDITDSILLGNKERTDSLVLRAMTELNSAMTMDIISVKEIGIRVLKYARELIGGEYAFLFPVWQESKDFTEPAYKEILIDGFNITIDVGSLTLDRDKDGKCQVFIDKDSDSLKPWKKYFSGVNKYNFSISDGLISFRNILYLPIVIGDRLLGQIFVANFSENCTETDITLIDKLADFYIMAIKRWKIETSYKLVENQNNQLKEGMGNVLIFLDNNDNISYSNQRASDLLQYNTSEITGKKLLDIVAESDRKDFEDCINSIKTNEQTRFKRSITLSREKTTVILEAAALKDSDGNYSGAMIICSQLIESKNNEQTTSILHESIVNSINTAVIPSGKQLTLFNELSELLTSCINIKEAYKIFSQFLPKLFPDMAGMLYIRNINLNIYECILSWGTSLGSEIMFDPEDCWSIRRGRTYCVADIDSQEICSHINNPVKRSYLDIPLLYSGKGLGMIHLEYLTSIHGLTDKPDGIGENGDVVFGELVAKQLAVIIQNINLREENNEQIVYDNKTGLYNLSYLEQMLEREIHIAYRNKVAVGLLLFDIGDIKKSIGTYGYKIVELSQKNLGDYIKKNIRPEDTVYSCGNGTFAVMMPRSTQETIKQQAESLYERVQYLYKQDKELKFNIVDLLSSVAIFPDNGSTCDELLKAANNALWHKRNKKNNRVITAENISVNQINSQ